MDRSNHPQESTQTELFKKLKKIKLNESEEKFKIRYIENNSNYEITEEDFNSMQESLFSDDTEQQSMAIIFFSQNITYVTPQIFKRIMSFCDSTDNDLIDSVIDFLCHAIRTKEISQDLIEDLEIAQYLYSIFEKNQNVNIKKSVIYAILLFSERLETFTSFFFEKGVFIKCCEIIEQNSSKDIQLAANCFNYINMIIDKSDSNQCDQLSEAIIPFYQSIIQSSKQYEPLAELTLNSIHYYIKQCDQGLSNLWNKNYIDLLRSIWDIYSQHLKEGLQNQSYVILYILINQYHIISYNDPSFFIQILPLFAEFIQVASNLPDKKDKIRSLCLEVLRNLAVNNDQTILEFLLSQPILSFVQSSFKDQPYSVIKRAAFVYSFLSISAGDAFIQFLLENNKEIISVMMQFLDISDPEFITNCFQCLLNILSYLEKTSQTGFDECTDTMFSYDIDNLTQDVLNTQIDEDLLEITKRLREVLGLD